MSTAISWTIYKVVEVGCGEPDIDIGYYQTIASAYAAVLDHNAGKSVGKGFCSHGGTKAEIREIIVNP